MVDLGKHLIDFFELYGTIFNYNETAISIRTGNFNKRRYGWSGSDKRNNSNISLAVENPQDPQVNIGMACYRIG